VGGGIFLVGRKAHARL